MSRRGGVDVFFSLGHTALYTLWITCEACDIGLVKYHKNTPLIVREDRLTQEVKRWRKAHNVELRAQGE